MKFSSGLMGFSGCSGSSLSQQQVYNLARDAGFDPSTARSMVAIAMRESSLISNCLATSVAGSSEASYGLWQINMSGSSKAQRLALFGLSDPNQLLDPLTNAKAAYALSGGSNLSPWHIDSDTATINGKVVNLGYRTKYLANLASLPADLESGYSGSSAPAPPLVSEAPPNSMVQTDPITGDQVYVDIYTGETLGPVTTTDLGEVGISSIPTVLLMIGAAAAAWLFFRD